MSSWPHWLACFARYNCQSTDGRHSWYNFKAFVVKNNQEMLHDTNDLCHTMTHVVWVIVPSTREWHPLACQLSPLPNPWQWPPELPSAHRPPSGHRLHRASTPAQREPKFLLSLWPKPYTAIEMLIPGQAAAAVSKAISVVALFW